MMNLSVEILKLSSHSLAVIVLIIVMNNKNHPLQQCSALLTLLFFFLFFIGTCEACVSEIVSFSLSLSLSLSLTMSSFLFSTIKWAEYNEIYRQTLGIYACRLLSVCKLFHDHLHDPNNPNFAIPRDLANLLIVSLWVDGYLVHFITNFPVLAKFMVEDTVNCGDHSKEAWLLGRVLEQGMIELIFSDPFGIAGSIARSRVLKRSDTIIALTHPDVDHFDRTTILSIPMYASATLGGKNNKEYREALTPSFFVGSSEVKLSKFREVQKIVGGRAEHINRFLVELKQRFVNQGSNEPVEGAFHRSNNTYHTVICGFSNPRANS